MHVYCPWHISKNVCLIPASFMWRHFTEPIIWSVCIWCSELKLDSFAHLWDFDSLVSTFFGLSARCTRYVFFPGCATSAVPLTPLLPPSCCQPCGTGCTLATIWPSLLASAWPWLHVQWVHAVHTVQLMKSFWICILLTFKKLALKFCYKNRFVCHRHTRL